ncbi:hypothetical protein Tco_1575427 [Tanacetum coccineum]
MEQMTSICDMIPICYNDDEDDTIAVTPILSTEDPVDSLIMEDEHLDTILATELDEVIKSSVENLVLTPSESEGIPDENMCDMPLCNNPTPLEAFKEHSEIVVDFNDDSTSSDDDSPYGEDIDYVDASPPDAEIVSLEEVEIVVPEVGEIEDDVLREKLSKINLLIAKIEAMNSNPPPSSDFVTKSPSTFPNLFLEETNTFDNSLPESETFCFDLGENSSGSTTTHADFSQYDSFIFDLSIDSFPPADRSDFYHEEFAGELAHIISPPEYDCFYFKSEPDLGELTSIVDSGIRENVLPTTNVNLPFEDDQSPLLAYVVWIFLPFLTYPVTPPYLLSCGNEDTIFDPGISIYHSFMPGLSQIFEASRARGFILRDLLLIMHMTGNLKPLCNFVEKYLGNVRFGNDQFALILGYGDLVQGNIMINRVYNIEGLNHNLFSVRQFCDADLEVAFWKSTCFVRDLHRNDLLTGNRGSDLYIISLQETTSSTPICLMAKASPTQAWLWH